MKFNKLFAGALASVMALASLTGCGSANTIDGTQTVATLNDEKIPMGVAQFMARYQQASYDQFYLSYFGEDMWESDITGSGYSFGDDMKRDVLDTLETFYLLDLHKAEYGVEITADDEAKISAAADAFIAANDAKTLAHMGADKANIAEYLRLCTVADRVQRAIYDETAITSTMDDAAQSAVTYARTFVSADTDEATLAENEEKLAAVVAAEDKEAKAEELGLSLLAGNYGKDDVTFPDEFKEALEALEEGQWTGVIKTDSYYYIGRLDSVYDEEATKAHLETLKNQEKTDHYNEVVDSYKADADWVIDPSVWAQIDFEILFKTNAAE